ncbi:hypothetical protein FACS1894155_03390 [Bacteroidia bacterium]|nr:hypothetical protein FACS1894155_03390 [Bacteroidia bacterium]
MFLFLNNTIKEAYFGIEFFMEKHPKRVIYPKNVSLHKFQVGKSEIMYRNLFTKYLADKK